MTGLGHAFHNCFAWFLNGGSISLLAPSAGPTKGVQDISQGDRERSMQGRAQKSLSPA